MKRLQDKAQVFPLEPHDAVRTRLTHSLEVSSVARGLVRNVCKDVLKKKNVLKEGQDRQIEAIAATCGLIHDLGNPPFGHSGEDAIREWFKTELTEARLRKLVDGNEQLVQDFLKFEGNAQTLRIVAKLQILADYNGLNLTFGTLSALCKYTAPSHEAGQSRDHAKSKPGYFASENELVKLIRDKIGIGDTRNPITFLVEAADDIVYSVADIEDGIKKGIISWGQLEGILKTAERETADAVQEVLETKDRILKAGRDKVPDDLPGDIHGSAFRTAAIGFLVEGAKVTFGQNYDAIMGGQFQEELVACGNTKGFVELLKKIGREHIYCTSPNLKLELMGRKIIKDLLDMFWEGVIELPLDGPVKPKKFPGKLGALLSLSYRKVFRHFAATATHLPEMYHRLRLLTDYICGMTDSFAKRLHAELTNA